MKGHDALKSHPFFAGVDWESVRTQKAPVPAHRVAYSEEDPARVVSFTLVPPPDGYPENDVSRRSSYLNKAMGAEGPEEAKTAETV